MTSAAGDAKPGVDDGELQTDLPFLVSAFGLGAIHKAEFIAEGLMNRNWRLATDRGRFVLKRLQDVSPERLERSLRLVAELAIRELPVCPALTTTAGDLLAAVDERTYCLLPLAPGTHVRGVDLGEDAVHRLGVLLGRIHQALANADLPAPPATIRSTVASTAAALAEADRFLGIIAARETNDAFDDAAVQSLHARKALLTEHANARPATDMPSGEVGWTHGDMQYRNLLWQEGQVTAVLDWDRLGVRPFVKELVRTAQVQFTMPEGELDLDRIAVFVGGYRSVIALGPTAIADAEHRRWWTLMTEFWPLQWHYDKNDIGPDEIWMTGERLLGWWTEHRSEVVKALAGVDQPFA